MKHTKTILLALLATAMLAACSKDKTTTPDSWSNSSGNNDDDNAPAALSADEKFVVGSWRLVNFIDTNYSHLTLKSITEGIKPCSEDDVYVFRADRKYNKEEGADTCLSSDVYNEQEWKIDTLGYMYYYHGPNPVIHGRGGSFTRIDDNNFRIYSPYYFGAANQGSLTYYYRRK